MTYCLSSWYTLSCSCLCVCATEAFHTIGIIDLNLLLLMTCSSLAVMFSQLDTFSKMPMALSCFLCSVSDIYQLLFSCHLWMSINACKFNNTLIFCAHSLPPYLYFSSCVFPFSSANILTHYLLSVGLLNHRFWEKKWLFVSRSIVVFFIMILGTILAVLAYPKLLRTPSPANVTKCSLLIVPETQFLSFIRDYKLF